MIRWKLDAGIWEVELGTEPCNEIGTEFLAQLEQFLEQLHASEAHSVIFYSSIKRGFSAGADLRELYHKLDEVEESQREPQLRAFLSRLHRAFDTIDQLPLVTIAVIHGVCFGGGFELALTCDLLVAERTARFCFPELRLGIVPTFGGISRLRREVGDPLARDLLLTGRSINAKRAYELGLVQYFVAPGQGLEVARSIAAQVGKFEPEARRACKKLLKQVPRESIDRETETFIRLALRSVFREALEKFVHDTSPFPYLP